MIEVPHLQKTINTVRRNRTVPGKGHEKVLIGQNLTRFLTFSRQFCRNDSFSFRIKWIME